MQSNNIRRYVRQIILTALVMGLAGCSSAHTSPDNTSSIAYPRPNVIAHRAGMGSYPENTEYAVRESITSGVKAIELDVQSSKDGVLIALHDEDLARTTDASGSASEYTYQELSQLDAGHQFTNQQGEYPFRAQGITIPSIDSLLAYAKQAVLILDLKDYQPASLLALCKDIINQELTAQVWLNRYEEPDAGLIRQWCPGIRVSLTQAELDNPSFALKQLDYHPFVILQAGEDSDNFEARFARAKELGVDIIIWSAEGDKTPYLDQGAMAIFKN